MQPATTQLTQASTCTGQSRVARHDKVLSTAKAMPLKSSVATRDYNFSDKMSSFRRVTGPALYSPHHTYYNLNTDRRYIPIYPYGDLTTKDGTESH